ncbi:unnamed protein product, partial [Prunus brigantina]
MPQPSPPLSLPLPPPSSPMPATMPPPALPLPTRPLQAPHMPFTPLAPPLPFSCFTSSASNTTNEVDLPLLSLSLNSNGAPPLLAWYHSQSPRHFFQAISLSFPFLLSALVWVHGSNEIRN